MARVLLIDDGDVYAKLVAERLPEIELVRARCPDGPSALKYLARSAERVDLVLLDVHFDLPEELLLPLGEGASLRRTQRFQGVAILRELRRRHPNLPVLLLTALEDLSLVDAGGELASQSMTYFLEADDLDTLRIRINAALSARGVGLADGEVLWGSDPEVQALRRRLAVLARGGMPLILEGETGTGKSFLAERFIHRTSGRTGACITADLSAVPRDLVPAYLFGARRGAYTGAVSDRKGVFELAHKGTLFIDEIQNVPLEVQKQLLVVLQEKRLRPLGAGEEIAVDVKIIAGSNQPLARAVAEGRFRQDLYMRLGPATRVVLPPLRTRRGDLPFLVRRMLDASLADRDNAALLAQIARAAELPENAPGALRIGRGPRTAGAVELHLPAPAWERLEAYDWPGNLRELGTVVHNLVTFTLVDGVDALRAGLPLRSPRLQIDPGLVGELLGAPADRSVADGATQVVRLQTSPTLNAVALDVERQYFRSLFSETRGDFARMAEMLLGDPAKARAVRLRFNQIGLRVRELR